MRVLFYLYPGLLSQGPEFSGGWSRLMLRVMRGLVCAQAADCRLVTALRFQALCEPEADGLAIHYLDDLALHRTVRSRDARAVLPSELSRQARSRDSASRPAIEILSQWLANACAGFEPDVVITFSMQAEYVRAIWPGARVLHVEAGAFSREPYPYSLFFDHRGMYGESVAARVSGAAPPASGDALALARDFRAHSAAELARTDPFARWDLRRRFGRLALLPLQVSGFFSFDEQAPYRTQFEFLADAMASAPPDVGVVVTEYIQWGEVLQARGSGANLDWLARTFPNLVFHESFRKLASPSQYLVPHVDGVLSVASNLGYQALLHGKRLWASAGSFLGNVAHDADLPRFFARLGEEPGDRTAFLAWYLERYAVPGSLAFDGAWFAGYLERRLAAIAAAGKPEEGFVSVDTMDVLRRAWLAPSARTSAEAYEAPAQRATRLAVTADVALANAQARSLRAPAPNGGKGEGYILLNDTRAIDGHLHLGCNAVTGWIETRLAAAGLVKLGSANDAEGCKALLADEGLVRRARLVVFNGEGSVRDDVPRIGELLDFCAALKARGIASVLVNSVWQRNGAAFGRALAAFSLVSVRESASREAIAPWRGDARLVPDLSFAAFAAPDAGFADAPAQPGEAAPIAVVDHVDRATAATLAGFAEYHRLPFYLMGRLHVDALAKGEGAGYARGDHVFPRVLRSAAELAAAQGCVTGRFHGFVAALCAGVPVAAVRSNTHKIEALARDAGLERLAILDDDWLALGHVRQREVVESRLAQWDAPARQSAARFVAEARRAIDALFDDVVALA